MNELAKFQIKCKFENSKLPIAKASWPKIYDDLNLYGKCYAGYIDNRIYHALPGISSTELREFFYKGEYAFHFYQKNQRKIKKKYFAFGTLVHEMFLEPEKVKTVSDHDVVEELAQDYVRPRTSKAYREWKQSVLESGHQILSDEEDLMIREWKAALTDSAVDKIFGTNPDIKKEYAYFYVDELSGLIVKCKVDLINQSNGMIVDLKTTADSNLRSDKSDEWSWTRDVHDYGYHIQQSFYQYVVSPFFDRRIPTSFTFIRLSKTPPYPITIAKIDKALQAEASNNVHSTLENIAKYYKNLNEEKNYCNSGDIRFIETKTTD